MLDTTIANVFNENAWPCGFATKPQTTKTNGLKAPSHLLIDGAATGAAVAVTCRKCEGALCPFVSVVSAHVVPVTWLAQINASILYPHGHGLHTRGPRHVPSLLPILSFITSRVINAVPLGLLSTCLPAQGRKDLNFDRHSMLAVLTLIEGAATGAKRDAPRNLP
jgi:hypothetical protein